MGIGGLPPPSRCGMIQGKVGDILKKIKSKVKGFLYRNRRYQAVRREGLNVLVETESSRSRRAERRENINMLLTFVSAVAAVVAAIFATISYINA